MRVRVFIAAIVAICIGGPIVEMFDQWDHTLQDGNDTEANVVIAALCVGAAFAVAGTIIARLCASRVRSAVRRIAVAPLCFMTRGASAPLAASSPPTPLRV